MRNFINTKRIVIKVGTNVLSKKGRVDTEFLQIIAGQIAELIQQQKQVILVTSGAIGMGIGALGIRRQVTEVKMRQACAAVGQGILMHEYQEAFSRHGQKVAQVLLTNSIMSNRKYYVNLKNSVETLLSMGVVPIINENDCVSIDEIDLAFGDNDRLSAMVASKIDAELLIMLTDVDGLYDKNPRTDQKAKLIPVVYEINKEIENMAGEAGTKMGTGGMTSKIEAIKMAANGGCKTILVHGRKKNVILQCVAGEEIGTLFLPKRRLSNRKRWILNSQPKGTIEVDPGATTAIMNNRSLLLVGITEVKGNFEAGEVVNIDGFAKGISKASSLDLYTLCKDMRKQKDNQSEKRKAIVHANDLVIIS